MISWLKRIVLVMIITVLVCCLWGCGYKSGDYNETSYVSYVYYKGDEATSDIASYTEAVPHAEAV